MSESALGNNSAFSLCLLKVGLGTARSDNVPCLSEEASPGQSKLYAVSVWRAFRQAAEDE